MPKWFLPVVIGVVALSLLPLAVATKNRASLTPVPRMQIVPDMDQQPRFKTQQGNALFADRRAMRPAVPGTVARGMLAGDDALERGKMDAEWITEIPVPVNEALLARGRARYDIYCSPCHGLDGSGSGVVSVRADALQEGTWTPPPTYHSDLVRGRPAGQLFNTITNGIRSMPGYGGQIPVPDRWAIVAYIRALQRSRHAAISDVPADIRPTLR
jgi:mono/diheme cytochrome c family protein